MSASTNGASNGMPKFEHKKSSSSQKKETPHKIRFPRSIPAVSDHENHREGRTIVVCLDGTGDKFDSDNSNIVHLVRLLKKDDPSQVTYYQAGIGTYGRNGLSGGFTAALDMAVGSELGLHVRDAYQFLMQAYKEGDRICLFGFSRGAYTARCLAGMIHKVGLLPPRNVEQISFAYEFYKDDSPEGWKMSAEFKKTFCIDVNVYFVGVFDSVSSVGVIPRQLPLSSTPSNKSRFFRHAIALDERRAKFKPCRFQAKDWSDVLNPKPDGGTPPEEIAEERAALTNCDCDSAFHGHPVEGSEAAKKKAAYESEFAPAPAKFDTNVSEVWFMGCHADVGGGAVKNEVRHKLASIPLRWMIRQCFECNTGIMFKTKPLAEEGLDIHSLWPDYHETTVPSSKPTEQMIETFKAGKIPPKYARSSKLIPVGHTSHGEGHYDLHIAELEADETNSEWIPEQIEDWFDAMSPMNDQLVVARGWWILELWPVEYRMQRAESDEWEIRNGMNLGRYRGIVDRKPQMHWTVQAAMNHTDYKLQARYGRNAVWQVVA